MSPVVEHIRPWLDFFRFLFGSAADFYRKIVVDIDLTKLFLFFIALNVVLVSFYTIIFPSDELGDNFFRASQLLGALTAVLDALIVGIVFTILLFILRVPTNFSQVMKFFLVVHISLSSLSAVIIAAASVFQEHLLGGHPDDQSPFSEGVAGFDIVAILGNLVAILLLVVAAKLIQSQGGVRAALAFAVAEVSVFLFGAAIVNPIFLSWALSAPL